MIIALESTLPETKSSHLKIDDWNIAYFQGRTLSFRECSEVFFLFLPHFQMSILSQQLLSWEFKSTHPNATPAGRRRGDGKDPWEEVGPWSLHNPLTRPHFQGWHWGKLRFPWPQAAQAQMWLSGSSEFGRLRKPSRERAHIPPGEKENHRLKSVLGKGFVTC